MNTQTEAIRAPRLLDFYEREVLPTLFERLDRAFPEFKWTRVDGGWAASRNPFSEDRTTPHSRIVCRQPWGFVADEGTAISWLAYANGGRRPVEYEIVSAVRKLADLARVDVTQINRPFTAEEIRETHKAERQRELLEAFAAYCHVVLYSQEGHEARNYLRRVHGLDWDQVIASSLGLYTSAADIHDYLASVGFTADEIHDSKVTRDVRLDGRVLVPWRDSCGRLKSIVAYATPDGSRNRQGRLLLNGRCHQEPFGLDVALRSDAGGREHLILVESILDVVFLQSLGLMNVASFGMSGRTPAIEQWERLADLGIAKVTLAYEDDRGGQQRTVDVIREANRARRCPELFVVPPDAFASARGPATFTRLNGLGQFRGHLDRRIHAYHFIAQMIVRQHRTGAQWTDAALVEVLNDAIRFDAATYRPERALALERFFWPPIVRATGADWEVIRGLLVRGGRTRTRPPSPLGSWELLDFRRLVRELSDCVESNLSDEFQAIVCAAADAMRSRQPKAPPKTTVPIPSAVVVPRRRRDRSRPVERQERPIVRVERPVVVNWPTEARQPEPPPAPPTTELDVGLLAYRIWEQKGRPANADQQCWYEAEQLVAQALAQLARQGDESTLRDWKSAA